jgi:hypothetical protein
LLHFVVEHKAAERFGRARPARSLRFRYRPVPNRTDRLTEHRTHDIAPLRARIISRECQNMNYHTVRAGSAMNQRV